jgi:hypothetical protein
MTMEGNTASRNAVNEEPNTVDRNQFGTGLESTGSELTINNENSAPRYKDEAGTDLEKGDDGEYKLRDVQSTASPTKGIPSEEVPSVEYEIEPSRLTLLWRRYRPFGHALIWLLVTA